MLKDEESDDANDVTLTDIVTISRIRVRCEVCGNRFAAHRRSAKTCSPACRQRLSRTLRARTPPLPTGPFSLIVADPPWHFDTFSDKGQGRSPSAHYVTMSIDSLCRLPIKDIAAPDAGLAMWIYGPRLPDALKLMKAWGFEYKSDLLTWIKTTKAGKFAFGTGYTTRKNTEMMI
jgi:MT-A70